MGGERRGGYKVGNKRKGTGGLGGAGSRRLLWNYYKVGVDESQASKS
jgi:hypothetical protein